MEENNEEVIKTNGETTQNSEVNSAKKSTNKFALSSFILSLVGLVIAGIPCGIAAFTTGILGITKFDASKEKNKWMAIFGIIFGVIDIIAVVAILPTLYKSLGIM